MGETIFRLSFYVPESHLEDVKSAAFAAGGGRIGDYDSCCWQVAGRGQFRPLTGSQPYLGQQGQVESVGEYKVEMVCAAHCIKDVVAAMIDAHPYEEPAWDVVQMVTELPE